MLNTFLQPMSVLARFNNAEVGEAVIRYFLNIQCGSPTENVVNHSLLGGELPLPPRYHPRFDR